MEEEPLRGCDWFLFPDERRRLKGIAGKLFRSPLRLGLGRLQNLVGRRATEAGGDHTETVPMVWRKSSGRGEQKQDERPEEGKCRGNGHRFGGSRTAWSPHHRSAAANSRSEVAPGGPLPCLRKSSGARKSILHRMWTSIRGARRECQSIGLADSVQADRPASIPVRQLRVDDPGDGG